MDMERKVLPFKLTTFDGEGRTMEGYASTFGNVDEGGDIVHQGAFSKTIRERGHKVKFLWQHDTREPIGKPIEIREDERGLFISALISDTARGRDALALLKDGAINEMSIGYDAVKGGTDFTAVDDGEQVRNLRELKLYEFSLVSFPMNEAAVVTALKEDTQQEPSEGKPWSVFPVDGEFCVFKIDGEGNQLGESLGCHGTSADALAQVRALFAAENDESDDDKAIAWKEVQAKMLAYYETNEITESTATDSDIRAATVYAFTSLLEEKVGRAITEPDAARLTDITENLVSFLEDYEIPTSETKEEDDGVSPNITINYYVNNELSGTPPDDASSKEAEPVEDVPATPLTSEELDLALLELEQTQIELGGVV